MAADDVCHKDDLEFFREHGIGCKETGRNVFKTSYDILYAILKDESVTKNLVTYSGIVVNRQSGPSVAEKVSIQVEPSADLHNGSDARANDLLENHFTDIGVKLFSILIP